MQKTGLTDIFLIPVNNQIPVYKAVFGMVTNNRANYQLGDPSASLLLTNEKAVFWNRTKFQ